MTLPIEIPKGFPETILANKTVFPSRLSCENNFGNREKRNILLKLFRVFTLLLITSITLLPAFFLRAISKSKINPSEQRLDFLFLSHYVGGSHAYQKDPFLGLVAETLRKSFKTFTFFLNSTNERASKAEKSIRETYPGEFQVNSFSWNIAGLIKNTFLISRDSLTLILSRNELCRGLRNSLFFNFFETYKSQLSILFAWDKFAFLLRRHNPNFILMPCEGNSHELIFLHKVKNYFPEIHVVMYQHAPLVVDQPGFYRVVANLRPTDILMLSSSQSKKLLHKTLDIQTIKCRVEIIGSTRALTTNVRDVRKKHANNNKPLHVLVAPEGTECSVNELLGFLQYSCSTEVPKQFRIRFHPDYLPSKRVETFLNRLGGDSLVSSNKLEDDLVWADEVWFRTSSVSDHALRLQVLPVHFNINPKLDLNPLKDLNQPYLQVKSLKDLQDLPKMRSKLGNLSFSREDKDLLFQQFDSNLLLSLFD